MQSLLTWGIQNSTPGPASNLATTTTTVDRQKLDPEIIDMILGRPDSELMKEYLAAALDENRPDDERIGALDQFEMLIEQIDNANNLQKLQLWEPLQSLLTSNRSSPALKTAVLWIVGTALQNNPAAQDDYMQYDPLPVLLGFLTPGSALQSRSKAIYALSGLLKHNAPAVDAVGSSGWIQFREALQDPDVSVRRKTMFLLGALLAPNYRVATQNSIPPNIHGPESLSSDHSPLAVETEEEAVSHANTQPIHANSHAAHLANPQRTSTSPQTLRAFQEHGILDAVISALVNPVPHGEDGDQDDDERPDLDVEEKGVRLLHTYLVKCHKELTDEQQRSLGPWISNGLKSAGTESALADRWNIGLDELRALSKIARV